MRGRHDCRWRWPTSFRSVDGRSCCSRFAVMPTRRCEGYPHHWIRIGQLGAFTRHAHAAGCRDMVFIGSLVRPTLWALRPDIKALMLLPRIMAAYRGGDNHLLSGVSRIVEDNGFHLLGAHEVAPEILVPEGVLGRVAPRSRIGRTLPLVSTICARAVHSISDRLWWSPASACWRSRLPKVRPDVGAGC